MLATSILVLIWSCQVAGYGGVEQLAEAIEGSDIVIIPAGVPRKPGMTRDNLFKIKAGIIKSLSTAISNYCPNVSSFWGDLIFYELGIWFLIYSGLLYMLIVDGLDFLDDKALVNMISNPVNSTVPIAAEVFKKA
ncbi:hypothetical protein Peur_061406 [Populus x canadensis]